MVVDKGRNEFPLIAIYEAYRLLYRANLSTKQALEHIEAELPPSDELRYLVDFIRRVSQRLLGAPTQRPPLAFPFTRMPLNGGKSRDDKTKGDNIVKEGGC